MPCVICKACVASCSEGDKFEPVWEEVHGAKGKASWRPARPLGKHVPAPVPAPESAQSEGSEPNHSVSDRLEAVQDPKGSPGFSEEDFPDFPGELPEELPEGLPKELLECLVPAEAPSELVKYLRILVGAVGPKV